MKNFVATIPQKLVFGVGKIDSLAEYANDLGKKAIIVTGKSKRKEKTDLINNIVNQLKAVGIESCVFDKVEENPTSNTCDDGAGLAKQNNCDFVIGVGGGSPMDAAKFIALLIVNDGKCADYMFGGKYAQKTEAELDCLPIIAVTTTSGTGSECTPYSVIVNSETNHKPGKRFEFWYPDVSIVDPKLMTTMPKNVTLHTGIDVFFHAFEAYVSKKSSEYTDMFCEKAMKLVVENLQKCADDPNDIDARSALAFANSVAGTAISLSSTIAIHGLAHPLGGRFNAAHGACLCSIGPNIIRKVYNGNIDKFAKASVILGADCTLDKMQLAEKCGDYLESFLTKLGINYRCSSFGVKEEDVEGLAYDTMEVMSKNLAVTPVMLDKQDVMDIYSKSL